MGVLLDRPAGAADVQGAHAEDGQPREYRERPPVAVRALCMCSFSRPVSNLLANTQGHAAVSGWRGDMSAGSSTHEE